MIVEIERAMDIKYQLDKRWKWRYSYYNQWVLYSISRDIWEKIFDIDNDVGGAIDCN